MVFLSDEELVRRIVEEQDRWAGEKLIERYYRWVYKLVYEKMGNNDLIMDVTHEIFLRVLKNLNNYSVKKAKFKTWLHAVAENYIIDVYRSRGKTEWISIEDISEEGMLLEQLEERTKKREQLAEVERYIDGLEEPDGVILKRKLLEEEKFAKIGQELHMPESSVKTRYYKAVEKMRKAFWEEET